MIRRFASGSDVGYSEATSRSARRALERLDPFELKERLIALSEEGARQGVRAMLDAGRGNPDWLALAPREAFFALGAFAMEEARRAGSADGALGGPPRRKGIARRLRSYLARAPRSPGTGFLAQALRYGVGELGFEADAFVHELADGIAGDHYPMPVRMLAHAERIVCEFLVRELCRSRRPRGDLELFAVEGATAGICYLFDSLVQNEVLRRGDRIALAVPIFAPYVALPRLARYGFEIVRLEASERHADGSHRWQYPDGEIDKLADPSIKALVVVNPSNPPSVAMRPRTIGRLVTLVERKRRDLILVSDDVYATFVPGFRSLLAALPHNTVALYSFSKYFGCTGWRLGVVALHEDNVIDRLIARSPRRRKVERRYAALTLDPGRLKFIDRLAADSRQVALNHTAGLSTPQQVQMSLLALSSLLDRRGRYKAGTRRVIERRLKALFAGLGAPLRADPLRAGYYCELDLMAWAERHYGGDFARYLRRSHEPVDLPLRLAERSGIVLMPGAGFAGPEWSVRVSLANLPEQAYGEIGAQLAAAAQDYVDEWRMRTRKGESVTMARKVRRARVRRKGKPNPTGARQGRGALDLAEPLRDSDASVEDPLLDWPELEEEKDQWVLERNGERDDAPDS